MAVEARRLEAVEGVSASRRQVICSPKWWRRGCRTSACLWSRSSPAGRGAPQDWQPGVVLRLPFSAKLCRDGGVVCPQALMALADTAMVFAIAAAWSAYRPMSAIDQTMHFLRPVNFDVLADARIVRIGRTNCFGRVTLSSAADKRPVGMVSSAYAML